MQQKHCLDLSCLGHADAVLRRLTGGAFALCVSASTAFAEVCDKVVGEWWRPSDGVVKTVFHWDWSGISPVVPLVVFAIPALFIGMAFLLKALRASARASFMAGVYLKWLSYGVAALTAGLGLFTVNELLTDSVLEAAAYEGCIIWTTNWFAVAATTFVVLLYGGTAWFMRRFARHAEAQFRSPVPL